MKLNLFKRKVVVEKKITVGTLLDSSPNGLNTYYFQVVEVKGKYCIIREIESITTKKTKDGLYYMTRPKANAFKENDYEHNALYPPMRRLIKINKYDGSEYVVVDKHAASIWNGKDNSNCQYD